jgi:hypothetical protein
MALGIDPFLSCAFYRIQAGKEAYQNLQHLGFMVNKTYHDEALETLQTLGAETDSAVLGYILAPREFSKVEVFIAIIEYKCK